MEIPKTGTSSIGSSNPIIEQPETKKANQLDGKQPQNTETSTKASQSLAEQSKANQSLQAEIQKSQLKQKLDAGSSTVTGTLTTTTTSTTAADKAAAGSLDELTKKHGLDAKQIGELKKFAKEHGVPEKDLIKVASNERYSGAEKTEAMKAYAITYDAANNGKLSLERAKGMKDHVLPNLLEGKIGIRLKEMSSARAQYNGLNEGNKDGYEKNTMYVPKEGLNLKEREDRAVLVHESQHAVQDATGKKLTFMQSEKNGHDAYADYLLRDSGAIKDTPNGPKLDYDEFDKLLPKMIQTPDKKCLVEQFAEAAENNVKNGKAHLNGKLSDFGSDVGSIIRSFGRSESFDDLYIETMIRSGKYAGKTEQQIRDLYNTPAPTDGI